MDESRQSMKASDDQNLCFFPISNILFPPVFLSSFLCWRNVGLMLRTQQQPFEWNNTIPNLLHLYTEYLKTKWKSCYFCFMKNHLLYWRKFGSVDMMYFALIFIFHLFWKWKFFFNFEILNVFIMHNYVLFFIK